MEYKKFMQLTRAGEKDTVDFKILSNAFCGADKSERKMNNAELVKDIIAMANNGSRTSYIIIGVADDGEHFNSVNNDKLTDDNLQNLCREYIFPFPKVKLFRHVWSKDAPAHHMDKEFVIMQIGPQAQGCFRFSNSLIDYERKYCFKKGEVWIRRGATSDVALPEEVKRLLEGKAAIAEPEIEDNVDYTRLAIDEIESAIIHDLQRFSRLVEGVSFFETKISPYLITASLTLPIRDIRVRVNIKIALKCTTKGSATQYFFNDDIISHGFLIISLGNVSASTLEACPEKLQEKWGWVYIPDKNWRGFYNWHGVLPKDIYTDRFGCAIKNVKSTKALFSSLLQVIEDMSQKEDIYWSRHFACEDFNRAAQEWLEEGCPIRGDKKVKYPNVAKKKAVCTMVSEFLEDVSFP